MWTCAAFHVKLYGNCSVSFFRGADKFHIHLGGIFMTDYDDQNSSEYKDQTTETAPAEQTGQQISSPADGQDTNQQVPDNRQMPPQNNGQDPYWQNPNNQQVPPQNSGQNPYWQNPNNQQVPPQNNGQNPYWQNPNNQQIPPQYNGQPPYWQDQPQRPRREKNSFAAMSLISGIFALLTLCCFAFPVAIICGVGAICFAIISKRGRAFRGTAIAGIILGVIAILLGIGEFFYALTITNLMKDPANAAAFNQFFEQFQQQFGIN